MDQQGAISRVRIRWRVAAAVLACATAAHAAPSSGHSEKPSEYDVKAAYLFNFGKFTRFPADTAPRSSFDICVLGHDDFKGKLTNMVANEQVNGLPERVVHVSTAAAARSCAIVYISGSESARVEVLLHELNDAPVLTVSDMPRFMDRGGMIEFENADNHVRFSVALDAVTHAKISLSSELLKVALQVKRGTAKGGK